MEQELNKCLDVEAVRDRCWILLNLSLTRNSNNRKTGDML